MTANKHHKKSAPILYRLDVEDTEDNAAKPPFDDYSLHHTM